MFNKSFYDQNQNQNQNQSQNLSRSFYQQSANTKQYQITTDTLRQIVSLNDAQSIFYTTVISKQKQNIKHPCILKCYGNNKGQQQKLRKLQTSTSNLVLKPLAYKIQSDRIYISSRIQKMSVQTLISLHKMYNKPIRKQIVKSFSKIYDTIGRMHKGQLFHGNLKPSNIFIKFPQDYLNAAQTQLRLNTEDIEWTVSEAGINQISQNKYYSKLHLINNSINNNSSNTKSMYIEPFQYDYHSLGVILLEMATLGNIQKIHEDILQGRIKQERYYNQLKNFQISSEHFQYQELYNFICVLLYPKEQMNPSKNSSSINSVNNLYRRYQQSFDSGKIKLAFNYKEYFTTPQNIHKNLIQNRLVQSILNKLKDHLTKQQIKCDELLKFMSKEIDHEDDFFFPDFTAVKKFLIEMADINIKEQIHLLFFANFFTFQSHIYYMSIFIKIFDKRELADQMIKKCIEKYKNQSQFFEEQTSSKDYWKIDDIFQFFHLIRVPFSPIDVKQIVKLWTGNEKATLIKLDEFRKIFRTQSQRRSYPNLKKQQTQNIEQVKTFFQELKKSQGNLVKFFRKMYEDGKWSVPLPQVRTQMKKYLKFKSKTQQNYLFDQIFKIAKISDYKNTIDYIRLLLEIKDLYDPIELFRMVLVQRINQDGIKNIYQKYSQQYTDKKSEKVQKGWTRQSLQKFCSQQYLDYSFHEIYQNALFRMLDKDDSGGIDLKQLMHRLTGIVQFDMQIIINQIKQKVKNKEDILNIFTKIDRNLSLTLRNIEQLKEFFDQIDVELQCQHYQEVYNKFMARKGQFQYLGFCRYFYTLDFIFMTIGKLNIEHYYKGDFNKFFEMGLQKDQKKWKRQSLSLVNQALALGFRQNQLNQLWKVLDKNQQLSLTRQQVGELFDKQVIQMEQFKGRTVDSLNDYRPKKSQQDPKKRISPSHQRINRQDDQYKNSREKKQNELEDNQLIKKLKVLKITPFLSFCFRKSESASSAWIQADQFCRILQDQKINCTRKFLESNFSSFIQKKSKFILLNYIKFFLCVAEFKMNSQKQKTEIIRWIMAAVCKNKGLKASDIMERLNISRIRLREFELILKDVLYIQVFGSDIDDVWQYWKKPKFLSQKNLQRILEESNPQALRDYILQETDKESPRNLKQPMTPFMGKGQERDNQRLRRQSSDSIDLKRFAVDQRQQNRRIEQKRLRQNQRQRDSQRQRQRQRQRRSRDERDREDNRNIKGNFQRKTSMQNQLYGKNTKQRENEESYPMKKKQLIQKFEDKLQALTTNQLQKLYMRSTRVDKTVFAQCLAKHYDFSKKQSQDLASLLEHFNQIRIQTIKKYLKGNPKKRQKQEEYSRHPKQKQRTVDFADKTPQRFESDKFITPITGMQKPQRRLLNPNKQKLNVPLIKQQIKILIRSFSQRFAVEQLDRYFFDQSELIYRDEFIKKCKQINTTLTEQNFEKIFDFLKPNEKDQVKIINFKMAFSFDQTVLVQEEYLPKQLIRQLTQIFNKHDSDKSGSIEPSEIQSLLSSLGFNESQKQIENIFRKIDKNFDNQISFDEFKDFIEQFILPHLIDFQNDIDQLFTMLKRNDVFNSGFLSTAVILAILQRFGVKLSNQEGVFLTKYIGNQNDEISIYDFLAALYSPCNPNFPPIVKSALYKIKLRKNISLKQIQKIFTNISSSFIMAYTSKIMKLQQLKRSTAFEPVLHESCMFYQDFYYKDFRKIQSSKNDKVLIDQQNKNGTILVELKIPSVTGVPIPQNSSIKGTIFKRSMNITFFDVSAECAKYCIATIQAQFDPQTEDQWLFDTKNRIVLLKISNYDAKKFEKILVLFELIITMNDNGKTLDVSCGSASISVKQLAAVQNKSSRKLKLTAGIPSKSKQIDRVSVTKRSGWKNFLSSSDVQSQLQLQISNQKNIDAKVVSMLYALPSFCLIKRKALHYIWTFRQYFAQRSVDKDTINPQFAGNHTVRAFLLSLDIEDISSMIINFWKQKIEQKVSNVWDARAIMYNFLSQLFMILNSKQFELKLSNPCASVITNKSLYALRQKMIGQVFENIENYVNNDLQKGKPYRRSKNYNYNYSPVLLQYGKGSLQSYINQNAVKVGK